MTTLLIILVLGSIVPLIATLIKQFKLIAEHDNLQYYRNALTIIVSVGLIDNILLLFIIATQTQYTIAILIGARFAVTIGCWSYFSLYFGSLITMLKRIYVDIIMKFKSKK